MNNLLDERVQNTSPAPARPKAIGLKRAEVGGLGVAIRGREPINTALITELSKGAKSITL